MGIVDMSRLRITQYLVPVDSVNTPREAKNNTVHVRGTYLLKFDCSIRIVDILVLKPTDVMVSGEA